ncbi:mannitol dehydrogenase family protein [Sphingomonas suaedae]|uniref:Mannitol dehydrogenase family protein n=1 Tax=Sphingomonas suaedae TaxID=2599297 RepID=A0A518RG55_9SPHN|nr:mannitol dehydrogenase family protein [Sphingomonas suaedae]QDX26438.1 mannitol dehydrogenase family protein [Sphingomonas suaedae]
MKRLSRETLAHLPDNVALPAYDPGLISRGVLHFGPGAFHRAHQASYFDALLARDPRWGITAVSLRSAGTVEALAAQDGYYTLAVLDREPSLRVIGAQRAGIGPGGGATLAQLLGDPQVRLVTSTVTEKGYCLAGDGTLDMNHPDIVADRKGGEPRSFVGWLVQGLAARRWGDVPPFMVLCCDNLSGNGGKLRAATIALARERDPDLAKWIADRVRFPDTMVDSITPASDHAFLAQVAEQLGVEDKAAVQREAFTQWVIGARDLGNGPDLASVGAILTDDVGGYERAKLRILNGLHSSLAYLGLALGLETVADAMAQRDLAGFAERLAHQDIVPVLDPVAGLDHGAYVRAVLTRFRNPAIRHLLSQIAWDGSQKLPYRLLDTVAAAKQAGRPVERLAIPVAAWMVFIARRSDSGEAITDPLAGPLADAARGATPAQLVERLFAFDAIFRPELSHDAAFRGAVTHAVERILANDIPNLLKA